MKKKKKRRSQRKIEAVDMIADELAYGIEHESHSVVAVVGAKGHGMSHTALTLEEFMKRERP